MATTSEPGEAEAVAPTPIAQGPADSTVPVLAAEEFTDEESATERGSIASSSTSVSSSIREYRTENGRTYHKYKDGKYSYPNDNREVERLDLQHNLFLLTFDNKLGTAPAAAEGSNVKRVLDVGTGSGIWAIEFGEEHPEAEVTGVDLSAIQPDFVPPNVKFEIDDIDEPWTYSQPFDYIHSRMMSSSVPDWKKYLKNCYDNLTPGGYVELNEFQLEPSCDDGTLTKEHALYRAILLLGEAMVSIGRSFPNVPELRSVLAEIGFRDVTLNTFKWPTNAWPRDSKYKELGIWQNENLNEGVEGFIIAPFTRILGWTKEEVQMLLIDIRKDVNNRNLHAYFPIYSLWARKPTKEEAEASQA
ncbi:Secondary metabolism regulator LAE1 [Colletotrichum spinosum]|uniref:Secondary metabolism regulator LAE1 n=1 Tax=Colletotrichum spinosum TaxID=1347390 RepID=A0A4R8Q2W9_9PEZI|nr:Secondary metabolism regulator LAE1 [Colletotrichum spinosum]